MRLGQNKIVFKTPLGWAGVAVSGQGISRIVLPKRFKKEAERELLRIPLSPEGRGRKDSLSSPTRPLSRLLAKAERPLKKYYLGKPVSFDLPLKLRYYTSFQQAVWKAASKIPYGETRSYAWVARMIRNPKAVRAVGQAMGANPYPIIVP